MFSLMDSPPAGQARKRAGLACLRWKEGGGGRGEGREGGKEDELD